MWTTKKNCAYAQSFVNKTKCADAEIFVRLAYVYWLCGICNAIIIVKGGNVKNRVSGF